MFLGQSPLADLSQAVEMADIIARAINLQMSIKRNYIFGDSSDKNCYSSFFN